MSARTIDHASAAPAMAVGAVLLAAVLAVWHLVTVRTAVLDSDAPLREAAKDTTFLLVLSVSMAALLTLTPQAVGPHHIILLWPVPALLAVSLVAAAGRIPRPRIRRGAVATLVLALACSIATQVRAAGEYRQGIQGGRELSQIWTPEIYPLARAVDRVGPTVDSIVVVDWGIGNQLLALGNSDVRRRLADVWPAFASEDRVAVDGVKRARLMGHRAIVVVHGVGREIMAGSTLRADAMLESLHPSRGVTALYRGRTLLAYLVDDRPGA
jgi:hypothetical protein